MATVFPDNILKKAEDDIAQNTHKGHSALPAIRRFGITIMKGLKNLLRIVSSASPHERLLVPVVMARKRASQATACPNQPRVIHHINDTV